MSKRGVRELTDTVSRISDSARVIREDQEDELLFDYVTFCKEIIKTSKKKADACLLMPLKVYHDRKDMQEEHVLARVGEWMNAFTKNNKEFYFFWSYLALEAGYLEYKNWESDAGSGKNISSSAVSDAKSYANDVSKLDRTKYIKVLCERRDTAETWILNAYEITLRKIYADADLAFLVQDIIEYLNKCNIKVNMPALRRTETDRKATYQTIANLMLLVTRIRLGINEEKALKWYKDGNVAYSLYVNHMLEEYMGLVDQYFYQSYERLIKMQELAFDNKNKYAAKEVGDIYRLGLELQDCHGNKILIKPDQDMACKCYGVCIDNGYAPAYISAVKTGALINREQKNSHLEKAKLEGNPEGLAYYIEQCIDNADKYVQEDLARALEYLRDAADSIFVLEDTYGEKYVLKNKIFLSKAFTALKNNQMKEGLCKCVQKLYSTDILNGDETEILAEMEDSYLSAKKHGYFEAEYRLGLLFQNKDEKKSRRYFEQGKEKGCNWCMLECARMQKDESHEEWLEIMMILGRQLNKGDEFQIALAREWSESGAVLEELLKKKKIEKNNLIELYLQILYLLKFLYKHGEKEDRDNETEQMEENLRIMEKLSANINKLKKEIPKEIKN